MDAEQKEILADARASAAAVLRKNRLEAATEDIPSRPMPAWLRERNKQEVTDEPHQNP